MALPISPPLEPMLAKLSRELPPDGDVLYEPKWDGFRCVVFRDGDDLDLQSRNSKPLLRYFPELRKPLLDQLPKQVVLDGELVVANERGLDFDALQLRQHPAESRVRKLSAEIPASYVAFDVLAVGKKSLLDVPFGERRAELESILAGASPPLYLTPATARREVAADWFSRFEGAGFDGVVAKPIADPYSPGKRTMLKVKHERTVDCAVAGYRMHKDGAGVGSLLAGLYDDEGRLHHVGVVSAMAAPLRKQLLAEIEPLRKDALEDHPWRDWAEAMTEAAASGARMPGGPSRWNANKDLSWEPLRIERVVEVEFEGMMNGRFRHNGRFRRWRDDKDPDDCTYAQLETIAPAELREMFGT
ncbi:MAG TPA: ATP-dependent DNA ligase [Acidimicrobiia bacterium]|nr:ATP-dependent DNA ligase [Acidimicrobiia bacterium]